MSTITSLGASDNGSVSRTTINTNFTNLNTDKIETSVIDTDTTLAANSDAKLPSQKAVKAYADALAGLGTTTSGVGSTPASSSTQTITHSLGRTPKTIRIHGIGGFEASGASNQGGHSHGTYSSSGNRCVYISADNTADPATATTYAINISYSNASGDVRWSGTGVIQNVTSTTFDLVWTISALDSHTLAYLWDAS